MAPAEKVDIAVITNGPVGGRCQAGMMYLIATYLVSLALGSQSLFRQNLYPKFYTCSQTPSKPE